MLVRSILKHLCVVWIQVWENNKPIGLGWDHNTGLKFVMVLKRVKSSGQPMWLRWALWLTGLLFINVNVSLVAVLYRWLHIPCRPRKQKWLSEFTFGDFHNIGGGGVKIVALFDVYFNASSLLICFLPTISRVLCYRSSFHFLPSQGNNPT